MLQACYSLGGSTAHPRMELTDSTTQSPHLTADPFMRRTACWDGYPYHRPLAQSSHHHEFGACKVQKGSKVTITDMRGPCETGETEIFPAWCFFFARVEALCAGYAQVTLS